MRRLPLAVEVAPAAADSCRFADIAGTSGSLQTSLSFCPRGKELTVRHFTADEANSLLPELKPLMADMLERRARIVAGRKEVTGILLDTTSNVGSPAASAMVEDFIVIDRLVRRLRDYFRGSGEANRVTDLNTELERRYADEFTGLQGLSAKSCCP